MVLYAKNVKNYEENENELYSSVVLVLSLGVLTFRKIKYSLSATVSVY